MAEKFKITYWFMIVLLLAFHSGRAQEVKLIYTTPTERWVEPKKPMAIIDKGLSNPDIIVYADSALQEIDGIGGAFNELGWTAIISLPAPAQKEVFSSLFSAEGCSFSMCRIPLGASDYALSYYSSNDVPGDFVMRDFNIDRDRFILLPYIREALKLRPDLQIWASPWTPPAWMKVNEHYSLRSGDWNGRPNGNRMDSGAQVFNNATAFKMQERYLEAYALYFSKFVQEYAKEGVPLFAIMPQNEIAYAPNWPSCTWRAEDLSYFIGGYLGPRFEKDSLDTEIWLGTVNYSRPSYVKTILDNEETARYIKGVGFQWGGSKSLPTVCKAYPDYKYMQTENKCGEGENDWSSVQRSWETLVHYFNHNSGSYMYWNMVLDETGKSAWGWPQNSMVVIDRETESIKYTDEFYLFKHLSHFVQPGDHYLKSSKGENHVAFRLKDGRIMVLLNNPGETSKKIKLIVGQTPLSVELEPLSINSIILNDQ